MYTLLTGRYAFSDRFSFGRAFPLLTKLSRFHHRRPECTIDAHHTGKYRRFELHILQGCSRLFLQSQMNCMYLTLCNFLLYSRLGQADSDTILAFYESARCSRISSKDSTGIISICGERKSKYSAVTFMDRKADCCHQHNLPLCFFSNMIITEHGIHSPFTKN